MKYLTLIQAVALLHQYQREVKRTTHCGQVLEYIKVQPSDIALANRLAHEVLCRTLDEMPPQTWKLLVLLKAWVHEAAHQQSVKPEELREVRTAFSWGDMQLKIHLVRLLEMEYLTLHRRGLTYEYALLRDGGSSEESHLCGLLDVDEADAVLTANEGGALRSGLSKTQ